MDKLNFNLKQQNPLTKRREPFRFLLGLGIFGSVMLFLLIAVVCISRSSASDWVGFPLPFIFWVSTAAMMLSSLTLFLANRAFHTEHFVAYRIQMGLTLALGLAFVTMQFVGWWQLINIGITLDRNIAGAFVYLLSGLHILHMLGGLFFLAIMFVEAVRRLSYIDSFVYSVNPPNQLKIKLVTMYWHFVDILWVFLFLFLLYEHA